MEIQIEHGKWEIGVRTLVAGQIEYDEDRELFVNGHAFNLSIEDLRELRDFLTSEPMSEILNR